jgi:FHA domain
MAGETRKLDQGFDLQAAVDPQIKPIDFGMRRPWRIAMRLLDLQMQMVFDLAGTMVVGRAHPETGFYPDIDLGAFKGGELGVSREHMYFKLEGERVVIIDNGSANGTQLNGEWLKPNQPYPLRHGDEITLGLMKLQVELLTNPFM